MPIDPIYNVTVKSKEQYPKFERNITAQHWKFDDKFTVECLDREQGITWIINERLPAFLKSDNYFEYRLAKLLSQLECKNGPLMVPQHFEVKETPEPKIVDKAEDMKKLRIFFGEFITPNANCSSSECSDLVQAFNLSPESLLTVKDNGKGQHFAGNLIEEITESDSSSEGDRDFYTTPSYRYNFKNRKGIEKFRKFILGTAGEKYWWLWIDIERLKAIEDGKKRQRYLNIIQNRYLFSNGEYYISAEARARLGLSFTSQWTMEKLCQIQKEIAEPLLLYWGPRYCMNQEYPIREAGVVLKDWEHHQLRSKRNVGPFPKTADICLFDTKLDHSQKPGHPASQNHQHNKTQRNHLMVNREKKYFQPLIDFQEKDSVKEKKRKEASFLTQPKVMQRGKLLNNGPDAQKESLDKLLISMNSFRSEVSKSFEDLELHRSKPVRNLEKLMQITKFQEALSSYKMDDLLQALQYESRTGYIFTRFCEQTGNPLWRNAINLWKDLREYQQLFYAEIFQPFKLKRQAQYIFATYIVDGSSSDVELNAENRKSIYKQLEPPFEDLFDQIEEHTLILLLVPWIHMIEIDMSRFRKVNLVRETRHLDTAYYKKLQKLQNKIWPNKEIILPDHSPSYVQIHDESKSKNYWQKVPEKFRNCTLDSIIDNRLEIRNFQDFLGKHFAGVDLNCWLDIEHFRKIPHNAEEERNNKSREIKNKYLNRKYFFGPSSPATKAQQNEIMMLAGGWGKLLHEQLSSEVLVEVQRYIRRHIENTWLPMFLATPEFAERHSMQVKMLDVLEDHMLQQSKKVRILMLLMNNKWISTSKEIVVFRKALLNPVTAQQFQQFVSFKGELMENNVLFWLEVQKYKDMCHSKATDESIQNKIKSIINCFINSNVMPPLQIDISQECADKIVNDMENQGIYIFREAQMAVFDILFKLWPDFTNFRRSVADEGSLQNIESRLRNK
ncbi:regulator of G-protein signaling 22-like [Mobula birostris]|uniref:regulator of G-protein signaling 22-like n=1 Tax=Mobula birostris TaxID=1983395 RepID=UPI003B27F0C6